MLTHYLKLAGRLLLKNKGYSLITIAGLTAGLACCLLITLWVLDELSFDRFHRYASDLYVVSETQQYSDRQFRVPVTPHPLGPALPAEVPEIRESCRMVWTGGLLLRHGEQSFFETRIRAVDPSFLSMFTFPLIQGDPATALSNPDSLLLDEEMAVKYFGRANPLGQTVRLNNQYDLKVTGVLKKAPLNSSLRFGMLLPYEFLRRLGRTDEEWGNNSILTLVRLQPGASKESVDGKIAGLIKAKVPESRTTLWLSPLIRFHLHTTWGYETGAGDVVKVYIFSAIAVFVLLIACINFMNLATARSAKRGREVGLRKVAGAGRGRLIGQFLGESVLYSGLALLLATGLVWLILPFFNSFTEKQTGFTTAGFLPLIAGLIFITLVTGAVAGSYPAFFLSSFQPVKVLKGELARSGGARFRKILVVFQFTLSVFLILGTLVVSGQLEFMKNKKPGFDREHVIYLEQRGGIVQSYPVMKEALRQTAGVLSVTGCRELPSSIGSNGSGASWDGKDPQSAMLIGQNTVDFDFVETMKMEITAGRSFSRDFPGDLRAGFLINEELAGLMAKKQVVGERLSYMGVDGKVVGVVKNFHYQPLQFKVEPLAMLLDDSSPDYLLVRLAPGDIAGTLKRIGETWRRTLPLYPFEYHFLEEEFEAMYQAEEKVGAVVRAFTLLTVFVACLGLFGLAAFAAEQRTKEIGIRKVLGASSLRLVVRLCREFALLVLLANLLAWPAAYFVMGKWLEGYAYRISLTLPLFLYAALLAMGIAVLSTAGQGLRAAMANPVKSLRYE